MRPRPPLHRIRRRRRIPAACSCLLLLLALLISTAAAKSSGRPITDKEIRLLRRRRERAVGIQDKECTKSMTLTRMHQDEQIEVEALLPSPVEAGEQEEGQAGDGKKQSHAGGGVPTRYYCIPLTVRIRKGATSCLEISCCSYPEEFVVERLEFGSSDESAGSLRGGPAFSDMSGELQKALHLYLGSRGISTNFIDFLHVYMINKECHEYLSWLRKLKGLVKG